MYQKIFLNKKAFTIIELIVIMAVLAILVFLGSLGYKGYTEQAQMTRLQADARLLSDACQRYYVDHGDYPRLTDTPYTADQVNAFSTKVYDQKGVVITLDNGGNYYDLDYTKLKKYVTVNEDYKNFILQNPVGDIYFLEPTKNVRLSENAALIPVAPILTVDTTNNPPAYNVSYPSGVTPQVTEYQLDGGTTVTSAPVDLLSNGNHNIKVRYKYNNNYSDWVNSDFTIVNGVKQISVGADHTLAVMQDGTVKSWGNNYYGQLGYSTNLKTSNPNPIPTTVPDLVGVKQVAAGRFFTIVLMQDGTVKAWGINVTGQLGSNINTKTVNPILTPTTISGLTGVTQVAAGYDYAAAVMQDGSAKSWGSNFYGQLGIALNSGTSNANPNPTAILGLSGVKHISIGYYHAAAVMQDGTVKTWGSNSYGQLGVSTNSGTPYPNPVPTTVPGLNGVKQIELGYYHTIALMQDGTVMAFGYNHYGQLGIATNINTETPNFTPVAVSGLSGVNQIAVGKYHSAALMLDGTVKSWGMNCYGELGYSTNNGTLAPNPIPTIVPNLNEIMQISAGDSRTVTIMKDVSLKAFGNNHYGQLGLPSNLGTDNPNPTPTTVSGL